MSEGNTEGDLPDVCVVTHPLSAAGENATRSLLDILAAITGVALVTANLPEGSEIRDKREVVELTHKGAGDTVPVAAVRFLLNQLRMSRVIVTRNEEVVLFYGAISYVLPMIVARLIGKTVLVEPRGDVPLTLRLNWEQRMPEILAGILADIVQDLERVGFVIAHGIITYTPSMARQLDLNPDAPNVYPTGARYVQTDRFDVTVPYKDRTVDVGFLGRLDEEKGIRELAQVARSLPDGVTVRFVGDGDLRGFLETELADEIDIGRVEIAGWVDHDDVPAELNRLKLLVLPSQPTEGLPTTILEAMACGTPVYATPVSGVPDVVRDGETGFLIAERTPKAMVDEILQILNEEDIAKISENGRSLVGAEYSFDGAVNRYAAIIDAIV